MTKQLNVLCGAVSPENHFYDESSQRRFQRVFEMFQLTSIPSVFHETNSMMSWIINTFVIYEMFHLSSRLSSSYLIFFISNCVELTSIFNAGRLPAHCNCSYINSGGLQRPGSSWSHCLGSWPTDRCLIPFGGCSCAISLVSERAWNSMKSNA